MGARLLGSRAHERSMEGVMGTVTSSVGAVVSAGSGAGR